MAAIFWSSLQMETLKLGRLFASRPQHEGLGKITNSSIVQQFLLAQSVSYALVTNQIAHYIIGPIESALAHLGVYSKADLIGPWRAK